MLSSIHPPQQRLAQPQRWAWTSALTGFLANALLALFFLRAQPFGGARLSFEWFGTANDWVIIVQFLSMIPVAAALSGWLPPTRSVWMITAVAITAMLAVAVLQLLLIGGALDFDIQVLLVVAAFFLVYAWVFIVSSIGHRRAMLPRSVTRFGLLLGASFPVALLIMAAGYLIGSGFGHPPSFAIPGIVLGALSWLAFPAWPLILARLVFGIKPQAFSSDKQ